MVMQETRVCWNRVGRTRHFGRVLGAWLIIGGAGLLCARSALAEEDATQAAREHFRQGVTFFDQKQFEKARLSFAQAYQLKRHPAVLLNLAQSELRSGKEADAAEHFAQFLRENKDVGDTERVSAEAGLNAAKAAVLELTVSVDEDGASLLVDNVPKGTSPLPGPLYLAPGARTISAKKDERESTAQVNAVAGQTGNLSLRVAKPTAAPKPVQSQPAPAKERSQATVQPAASPPATAESRGRPPFTQWAKSSPVAWVGGGLTALGIGAGIGFAIGSRWAYNRADGDAEQIREATREDGLAQPDGICVDTALQDRTGRGATYRNACKQYQDDVSQGDSFKTVSIASWVVAGAAAAGTVIYYFVAAEEKPPESARSSPKRVQILPVYTADQRGLLVLGHF